MYHQILQFSPGWCTATHTKQALTIYKDNKLTSNMTRGCKFYYHDCEKMQSYQCTTLPEAFSHDPDP